VVTSATPDLETRARLSGGTSSSAIYRMVAKVLAERAIQGGVLIDVGCGAGGLRPYVKERCARYIGIDCVRYEELPSGIEFHRSDLDGGRLSLPDELGDVVIAVETVEHLENPRAFFRDLTRLAKPGGWIMVTTPNQLSFLSLATLVLKKQFNAFQQANYPAHITALLEIDLSRMAAECGWQDVSITYSRQGRIILTRWHYPRFISRILPRACSDNVLLIGRKPLRSA
jgi:2-polyprenyl-3-methyl-5-hydroxy-6-metoxy-1,4-benzoquinol methylase